MVDIAKIVPLERAIEIVHPATSEQIGLRVTIMSLNDERLTREKRRIQDANLVREQRGKVIKAEQIAENTTALCFAACTGWEWHHAHDGSKAEFNGKQPEFNQANFRTLIAACPWVEEQLTRQISDDSSFF